MLQAAYLAQCEAQARRIDERTGEVEKAQLLRKLRLAGQAAQPENQPVPEASSEGWRPLWDAV